MKVYTYLENIEGLRDDTLIEQWQTSWLKHGWEPVILNRASALLHRKYQVMVAKAATLPTTNNRKYEEACYLRWLAVAAQGGGLMVDIDTINFGFTPEDGRRWLRDAQRLICFNKFIPSAVIGKAAHYEAIIEAFLAFAPGEVEHISDMLMLKALQGTGLFDTERLCRDYARPGWERVPLVHIAGDFVLRPKSRTVARVLEARTNPPMYGYYDVIPGLEDDALLHLWQENWMAAGWWPVLLNAEDAAGHELYGALEEFVGRIPTVNPRAYTRAGFLRWLALARQGGGLMVDIDVFSHGWTPELCAKEQGDKLSVFDGHVPCAVLGDATQYAQIIREFLAADLAGMDHVSDMMLLAKLRFPAGDKFAAKDMVSEYSTAGWEDAPMVHYATVRLPRPKSDRIREIEAEWKQSGTCIAMALQAG